MGKQTLVLRCRLENVDELHLPKDEEWCFIMSCSQCGEKAGEQYFNAVEEYEMEKSRSMANYIAKCKF